MPKDRRVYDKTVAAILKAVKRGEKHKMDELFSMTFNHFYGYALVALLDKSKAEDAVMAMYERVMKYIDTYNSDENGTAWMFTILKHIVSEINAGDKDRFEYERRLDEDDTAIDDLDDMYNRLGLRAAVCTLDQTDRKIFYMYYFEHQTLDEIATKTSLSKSAVHKRKKSARKALYEYLYFGRGVLYQIRN